MGQFPAKHPLMRLYSLRSSKIVYPVLDMAGEREKEGMG